MILKLVDVCGNGKNSWMIVYTAECDCGCKQTRHIAIINQTKEPNEIEAKEIIDADYNQQ